VQCLVDEQTEFERDALRNTQPMQSSRIKRRHVVILAAAKDDTSGTVQDALLSVCCRVQAASRLLQ